MNDRAILEEILSEFGADEKDLINNPISLGKVKGWMANSDMEVLGALYTFLLDEKYSTRIQPPLPFEDCHAFVMNYYERCLKEDSDGEWADSRYGAGADLVNWFIKLWNDATIHRKVLADIKEWLARNYKEGNVEIRTCIINATLEHLFEKKQVAKYFSDWKKDPILEEAYEAALDWSKGSKKLNLPGQLQIKNELEKSGAGE